MSDEQSREESAIQFIEVLVTPSLLVNRMLEDCVPFIASLPADQQLFMVQELASLNKAIGDLLVEACVIHPGRHRLAADGAAGRIDSREWRSGMTADQPVKDIVGDGHEFVDFVKWCLANNVEPWAVMRGLLANARISYDIQTNETIVASQVRMPS